MILLELLGLDKAPGRNYYKSSGKAVGRPNEHKLRPRPRKNLWFDDDKLWVHDLDTYRNRNYKLMSTEDEESILACNDDQTMCYGSWSKKENRGITFKDPRPIHTVVHPKLTLKDFIVGTYPSLA